MFQLEQIIQIAGSDKVRQQEPMSAHTTFRIGGPAKVFAEPQNQQQLIDIIQYCREVKEPWFVVGNGSNLLVSDEGYDGVIVSTRGLQTISFPGIQNGKELVEAESGILLSSLAAQTAGRELAGLEFAGGIPGTLGGAVTMNAGAYGGEINDVIVSARIMKRDGSVAELNRKQLQLSYRNSIIQEQGMIVLSAVFALTRGNKEQIQAQMKELNSRRREKQPLEYGSAGSTFKRPEGHFAGKLIQDAGLKGYRVGDIMVSEKHSGFIVNVGKGTYCQALEVIEQVQSEVKKKFGILLELEVKRI